jgi:hypothetical protein
VLACVCSHWRRVFRSEPILWRKFELKPPLVVSLPDGGVEQPSEEQLQAWLAALRPSLAAAAPHVQRFVADCRDLQASGLGSAVLELPLLLDQLPFQQLASLSLKCPPPYVDDGSLEMEAAVAAAARLALRRFAHLTSLSLVARKLLPEDASALAALTALRSLHLSIAADIPPDVAAAAVSLQGLTKLQLQASTGPPPSRGVLSRLASLPRLQDLKLHWTQDCDACLEIPPASALPALRGLDLWCGGGVQEGGFIVLGGSCCPAWLARVLSSRPGVRWLQRRADDA